MKIFFFLLILLVFISCSETTKTGCKTDEDCSSDRICDVSINSCVTCKPTMCNYVNAVGVCKANEKGKISCALGDCKKGFWNLDNDDSNGCEYSCEFKSSKDDNCDGKDDNCNGEIDEDVNTALPETCGGCNNNCLDKVTTNKDTLNITCDSVNKECIYQCKVDNYDLDGNYNNGCEYNCHVSNNGEEVCDSADNNCDGNSDEGLDCSCDNEDEQSCTIPKTSCTGTQSCSSGVWDECSSSDINIGVEICDGIDNDCNDGIDEDFKTGDVYTDNDNCGGCNQKCEEINGTNTCDLTGVCRPICENGFSNFDNNGFNGCETGCSLFRWPDDNFYKVISSSSSHKVLDESNSFYKNNKILLVYTKDNGTKKDIVAKVLDGEGNTIIDEKNLTQNDSGAISVEPSALITDNYYYVIYCDDYNDSHKVKLIIKDPNLNIGNELELSSLAGNSPYISKENFIPNKIVLNWSTSFFNFGGRGLTYYINIYQYDEISGTLDTTGYSIDSGNNLTGSKTTTMKDFLNGEYIAVAYCESSSNDSSNLKIKAFTSTYSDEKNITVDSFNNDNCNDFKNKGALTSSGSSFYLSYIKDNNFSIKKYTYSFNNIFEKYSLVLSKTYEYSASDGDSIINTSINYKNNNLLAVYSTISQSNVGGGMSISTTSKSYMRFDSSLNLKDSRSFIFDIGYSLNSDNNSILYTDDNKIIIQYEKWNGSNKDIQITKTDSCGN